MTTLLIADHDNKSLKDATAKALTAARALGGDVHVLIAGADCRPVAEEAAKLQGVAKVLLADALVYHEQFPKALVNRYWGTFFGRGFVNPIDDFNDQNLPSNPELLDELAAKFKHYGYDLKSLIRWICNSEAYNLSSRLNPKNPKTKQDNPAAGDMPLFSHLYLKSMTAEQLYDSLIVATNAHKSGTGSWEKAEETRQRWMQQFIQTFGTDENDESTTFDGTIPQALMMMNGELMRNALNDAKGTLLYDVLNDKGGPTEKIKHLYQATLSRTPSPREIKTAERVMQHAATPLEAFQDLYWALLNSNEFIMNH